MIPSWAKPGAKVVCVDDFPLEGSIWVSPPVEGVIYTITDTFYQEGVLLLRLKELRNFQDIGYLARRFHPLITEADDIALFKSLLNPTLVDKLDLLAERMNELAED
jgi:hypothetical protein